MKPNYVTEKTYLFGLGRDRFFLFLSCISYTTLVNIITLSGTHDKKEPLGDKGFKTATFYRVYSFLYILDMTTFCGELKETRMYKKRTFYTYARSYRNSLFE
ncbi:hypothetical protein PMEGAPL103_57850 [Priestia megaterium]